MDKKFTAEKKNENLYMGIFVHCSILAYETGVRFIQKNVLRLLPNCTEEIPTVLVKQ